LQSGVSVDQVEREIGICGCLNRAGLPAVKHLLTRNGGRYFSFGGHICYLYEWIDGTAFPNYSGETGQLIRFAGHYASLLKALETLPMEFPRSALGDCSADAINESIQKHDALLERIQDETVCRNIRRKITYLEELKASPEFDFSGISWKKSHGDYTANQLLLNSEDKIATLDFLSARIMPISFELFRFYLFFARDFLRKELNFTQLAEYLKAFAAIEPLTERDVLSMIPLYYVRILKSVFGYQQLAGLSNPSERETYLKLGNELFEQVEFLRNYLDQYDRLPLLEMMNRTMVR